MINDPNEIIRNSTSLRRSDLLRSLINVGKDINYSCGYPNFIAISDYSALWEREGVASRVVRVLPEESWKVDPKVIENEDA